MGRRGDGAIGKHNKNELTNRKLNLPVPQSPTLPIPQIYQYWSTNKSHNYTFVALKNAKF
ncbi:MAG: hypothetical protein QNJ54_13250 [Prochloraceae cyanobacterium]|nr:hypothetical protein [Prochloraceae cyanobacterium]